MSTIRRQTDVLTRYAPAEALTAEVRRVLGEGSAAPYRRVAVTVEGIGDPLAWLAVQPACPRFYWHGRDDGRRVAALGEALAVTGDDLNAVRPVVARLGPEAQLFGGLRFDPQRPPEPGAWRSAEAFRFTLPLLTLEVDADGSARLVAHLVPHAGAAVLAALAALADAAPLDVNLPLPVARQDLPDRDGWNATVGAALAAFRAGQMDKVVPARRVTFDFPEPLDPFALMARLEAATPGTYHLLAEHGPGAAFVSASPERLFRLEDGRIWTEALAGTRPRGATATEDARLSDELHASDKEQREHALVRDAIAHALGPLAAALDADETPEAFALARGRHLRTPMVGRLRPGVSPLDVLAALHPTPAVGGTPTPDALAFLRAHEPFDRGRYAAPFGWLSLNAAEFAVGLRCGRVDETRLALYSGAGVVEGSTPEAEWAEIEDKIADFVAVLGLAERR
ncbi:MAG: isochorismate synthase [Rhodothermales bacterium]|nr:isochorismate synthase [Rhodothermales bacterium]MCA0268089.1 isochorismate synthase [Bacteroidota bacterium]